MLFFTLVSITIASFVTRFSGLHSNPPFWVDEFNTGTQARLILEHGLRVFTDKSLLFEFQNITTHFLVAGFFSIFGQYEWVARLPMVIIGSCVPLAVYLLAKQLSDKTTATVAATLITFTYFEIVWSRQARGYVLLQLLILLALYLYTTYIKPGRINRKTWIVFGAIVLLGVLTHYYYLLVLVAVAFDYLWHHKGRIKSFFTSPLMYILPAGLLLLLYGVGALEGFRSFFYNNSFSANNVGYYHSFLWREYGLITFLSIIGWGTLLLRKKSISKSTLLYMLLHLTFVTFFFSHHMSKYLLPIFPLIIIGAAMSITTLADNVGKHIKNDQFKKVLPIFIALFIVLNGDKFVNRPKAYYSINHDFREISNIDYHKVYEIILTHKDRNPAVVETWPGRMLWYLGNNYPNGYMFRWENEEGSANGHVKKTEFYIENGEKRISKQIGFVGTKEDLEKVIKKNKVGFIFIDDSSLPQDVIQYAEMNLKKELYLDHYPLDDNPYSIWPATLYSWGL